MPASDSSESATNVSLSLQELASLHEASCQPPSSHCQEQQCQGWGNFIRVTGAQAQSLTAL